MKDIGLKSDRLQNSEIGLAACEIGKLEFGSTKATCKGNVGDTKSVGYGVHELRMQFGPGYRIYYIWRGEVLILLLTGGDKDSQARDIAKAKRMAKDAEDGIEDASL